VKIPFKIPKYLTNRYALTGVVFLVWILFLDQNNIVNQLQYRMDLNELEGEKEFYVDEIEKTNMDLEELKSNPKTLEKFAREKYLMKKDNEELFVIVEEE
jgi:cell division protein FtsB